MDLLARAEGVLDLSGDILNLKGRVPKARHIDEADLGILRFAQSVCLLNPHFLSDTAYACGTRFKSA